MLEGDRMNILKFSKYPPIEGGESSKAYWLSKAIGGKGHNIFLVTNAFEVENECRIKLTGDDLEYYSPKNVQVHNTSPFLMPPFFPAFNPETIKLISKGIEIIKNNDIDIIEGSYLLPYGFAAHYLAQYYKKPLVITHAGSDLTRLLHSPHYSNTLRNVLSSADKIITFPSGSRMFTEMGIDLKKITEIKTAVNTKEFSPNSEKANLSSFFNADLKGTILTHFGKLHRTKGIYELADAVKKVKGDFSVLFFGEGKHKKRPGALP